MTRDQAVRRRSLSSAVLEGIGVMLTGALIAVAIVLAIAWRAGAFN